MPWNSCAWDHTLTIQQLETLKKGLDGFERVLNKYKAFPERTKQSNSSAVAD